MEHLNVPPVNHVKVLDGQGWVGLIDHLGTESTIVNAARVSFGKLKSEMEERAIAPSCAALVTDYMTEVVESGTGTGAKINGITVAGKTGTAETGEGMSDHSWFIGFAPFDNPTIAVAVVLEHGGAGGGAAGQ